MSNGGKNQYMKYVKTFKFIFDLFYHLPVNELNVFRTAQYSKKTNDLFAKWIYFYFVLSGQSKIN